MMRLLWALLLSGMTLSSQAAQLRLPDSWQLLALMPRQSFASHGVALAPGEYQLLVRYEGVIPARSSSDFDETFRSQPLRVRVQILGDGQLQIMEPALADGPAMAAFAKAPRVTLTGEAGQLLDQQPVPLKGFVLGTDYQALLEEQLALAGAHLSASPVATTTAVAATATPSVSATVSSPAGAVSEAELQRLFLQADPALRKRFVSWAIGQL
ncbi:DUF2057 family protein [Pseudaeromonas paramecii]|uniref:DUF2057 domain-containing protein n=1 Tax=Pseudaeromonas paramecii TaxID=2138166 RepID=A0ABP8Q5E0_9GAMM